MRFRNPKTPPKVNGAIKPSPLGRQTRSRLFVPMDSGRQFAQVELGDKFPSLHTMDANGNEVITHSQPFNDEIAEWALPILSPQLPDSRPPDQGPVDNRKGGADRPDSSDIAVTRSYSVSGSSSSRSLDVSTPTATNCARVLNALLEDLSLQRLLTR